MGRGLGAPLAGHVDRWRYRGRGSVRPDLGRRPGGQSHRELASDAHSPAGARGAQPLAPGAGRGVRPPLATQSRRGHRSPDGHHMPTFRFSHPIEVRYADLDPQRHVNNATLFSYLEQARARYLARLGLWDGKDFDDIGIIVAEAHAPLSAAPPFSPQKKILTPPSHS